MLFFALFTIGYFAGVLTVLAIFPPGVKEIQEQEEDALGPVLNMSKGIVVERGSAYKEPALSGS